MLLTRQWQWHGHIADYTMYVHWFMHQIGRAKSSWLSNTHRKPGHWSKYTLFNLFGKNKHFSTCTWPFTIWCERTESKTADYLHKSYNFRVNVHKSMEKKMKTGKRTGQDIYANNWIWTNDEKTDCKSFGFWSFVHMNEQAYMHSLYTCKRTNSK